jgi:hypothetical protein
MIMTSMKTCHQISFAKKMNKQTDSASEREGYSVSEREGGSDKETDSTSERDGGFDE